MTETTDWRDGYRSAVAAFIVGNPRSMFVNERYYHGPYEAWQQRADDDYDDQDVMYGWGDFDHLGQRAHQDQCRVVSTDPTTLREQSLSQFQDTMTGNRDDVGVEVKATCACGKYTNRWLRWTGTTGDILAVLLADKEG